MQLHYLVNERGCETWRAAAATRSAARPRRRLRSVPSPPSLCSSCGRSARCDRQVLPGGGLKPTCAVARLDRTSGVSHAFQRILDCHGDRPRTNIPDDMIKKQLADPMQTEQALLVWSAEGNAPQVYADEVGIQYANGKAFISFGQVQLPPALLGAKTPNQVTMLAVSRVVLTRDSFLKMVAMFNNVVSQLDDVSEDSE